MGNWRLGWPVWLTLRNRPETLAEDHWRRDRVLVGQDPGRGFLADHPKGRMFLMRKLAEDPREIQGVEPRTVAKLTLPVWGTGECLLRLMTRG